MKDTVRVTIVVNLPVRIEVEARWNDDEGAAEIVGVLRADVDQPGEREITEQMTPDDLAAFDAAVRAAL